jgi:large conductance mechanosensitive channel
MLKDFREFIARGNVIDLAVGVIIGGAFGKIVSSLVSDMVMPPLGLVLGRIDFSNLFINLGDKPYKTLAEAKAAGAPTINYGVFIDNVIQFFILAFVVFLLVRAVTQVYKKPAVTATTKPCPFCAENIPLAAKRCGHCTSDLAAVAPVAAAG